MEIIKRSLIMIFLLFIIVKIMGQKQIKNLTLFDYILSISIGSIAADSIISLDVPIINGILALATFTFVGYIITILSYHNHKIEEAIDGEPIILFKANQFFNDNLEKTKLSVAKVLESCRLKGCFDINNLDCAVLEPSGDISVLLKNSTIKKTTNKEIISRLLVVDGVINEDELKKSNKSKRWLNNYLKRKNIKLENINLLSINKNNKISLYIKTTL